MNKSSYCALWLGALVASSATLAAPAHAQSCGGTDCGPGFECKTESYQSCSGGGMGGFGEPPIGGTGGFAGMVAGAGGAGTGGGDTEVVCETVEYHYCANATCETNADCPETMGCLAQTTTECTVSGSAGTGAGGTAGIGMGGVGGGCSDDGGCSFECHEVPADSICVPRYQIPCQTASDCGGGFDCVESFGWVCGGGAAAGGGGGYAGMGAGGAGGAPAVEDGGVMQPDDGAMSPDGGGAGGGDYTCEQVSNGFNQCELQVLPCASNADCPAGLECSSYYEYPECTYDGDGDSDGAGGRGEAGSVAIGGAGGTSGTAGTGETGGMGGVSDGGVYSCPEPIITQRCQLPGYEGGGMGGTGGTTDPGGEADAGSDNGSAGMGGGAGGAAGTAAAGMSGSAGEGEPDDDGSADEGHGQGHHGHGRGLLRRLLGCSTSGPISGGSSTGGWLMLGLSALVLRRRIRRS